MREKIPVTLKIENISKHKSRFDFEEIAEEGKVQIPTMVYPQVEGITPTVVKPSETKAQ